jgi:type I restriction enzyme S subunit
MSSNRLPIGWQSVPLGDLGTEIRESVRPTRAVKYELYSVPAFADRRPEQVLGAAIGSSKRLVRAGDLLVCKINPRINRVWLVSPAADGTQQLASPEYLVLRFADADAELANWVQWYLRSPRFRLWIRRNVEGATGSHTRAKSPAILRQTVPIAPADERRQIVAALEEQTTRLDAAVASLKSALSKLERFREATIRAGVTGRLLAEAGREPPPQPHRHAEPDAATVPSHWRWRKLGEIANIRSGVTKDAKREGQTGAIPVPYLRVANVQRGRLDLSEVKTVPALPETIDQLRLLPGDILLNEGGDRDKLGRGWVWSGEIDPCIHQNHVFRARLTSQEIDPRFISWYANSFGQTYFLSHGKQTTNLASINRTQLAGLPVPVPPIDEQRRVVGELEHLLSVIDSMRGEIEAGFRRATVLRDQVLEAAFSGQLNPRQISL